MGHKVHPYGFRLGYTRTWTAKWYADKEYTTLLKEDIAIRQLREQAARQRQRERRGDRAWHQPRDRHDPHRQAGHRDRQAAARTSRSCASRSATLAKRKVKLEIKEIRQPELDAYLVALNIAQQLTRRIAFKKAMKQAIQRSMKAGAKGVKMPGAGRLGGCRDGSPRVGPRGSHPAGHPARRHQLRPGPRPHDLWPHRRQGLDLQGRDPRGAKRREAAAGPAVAAVAAQGGDAMLMPRRVKHRKVMRGRMSGQAKGGHTVAFGEYGLATLEPAWITARQIEAARRAMTRSVKRGGKIWIRVFPDKPVTKKPAETRMGSGKGAPDHWVAVVRPAGSCSRWRASSARRPSRPCGSASHKLPGRDPRRRPRDREGGHRWRSVRSGSSRITSWMIGFGTPSRTSGRPASPSRPAS